MELTKEHLERIKDSLPVERGNVSIDVLRFLAGPAGEGAAESAAGEVAGAD